MIREVELANNPITHDPPASVEKEERSTGSRRVPVSSTASTPWALTSHRSLPPPLSKHRPLWHQPSWLRRRRCPLRHTFRLSLSLEGQEAERWIQAKNTEPEKEKREKRAR